MDKSALLERYAQLLVRHGANVQPGQLVLIGAEVVHRELAYLIAQEAYRAGASNVTLDLSEPRLQKYKLETVKDEFVSLMPKHISAKYQQIVDEGGATIRLIGPEFPLLLAGLPPKRVNDERFAFYNAVRSFYEEGIGRSKIHWTIGAAATPAWGKRVFPELSLEQAEDALWNSIFSIVRVDRPDFMEDWKRHNDTLHRRCQLLNDLRIKNLRFTGPETDLSVGLSERALFKGGTDRGPTGQPFEPNIPTEECFTTPDFRRTNGVVKATRPFLVNGVLVDGLKMHFKEGVLESFDAKSGSDSFREYIGTDPGAKRLGEVALVGTDSPVFASGRIFEEILFDENAACHIAIGSAYKFCIRDSADFSKDDLNAIGCNESAVHTDMMISNEEVSVTAETFSGDKISLIRNGAWEGDFR